MQFKCVITTPSREYDGLLKSLIEGGYIVESYHKDNKILSFNKNTIGSVILLLVTSKEEVSSKEFMNVLEEMLDTNSIKYYSIFVQPPEKIAPSLRYSNVPMEDSAEKKDSTENETSEQCKTRKENV